MHPAEGGDLSIIASLAQEAVMRASIKICVRSLSVMVSIAAVAVAQTVRNPAPLDRIDPSLITEVPRSVPDPVQLAAFIGDKTAALKLGKALFWDMQVGSDGITACASCHFHAGADSRSKNQVSPGVLATPEDVTFSAQLGGAPTASSRRRTSLSTGCRIPTIDSAASCPTPMTLCHRKVFTLAFSKTAFLDSRSTSFSTRPIPKAFRSTKSTCAGSKGATRPP
jgi:cytochrome c peroxidase